MSDVIDPYYQWLGIPPKHQPADHYRLLGIERFESNLDVIRDAADRQMTHVRSYQLGQYLELSQQVLNELAAARICMLNPDRKAVYDEALRRRLGARPMPSARPLPVAAVSVAAPASSSATYAESPAEAGLRVRLSRSDLRPVFAGVAVAVAVSLLGALAWWGARGSASSREPAAAGQAANAPSASQPAPPMPPTPPVASSGDAVQYFDALSETAAIGPVNVRVVSVQVGKPRVLRRTGRIAIPGEDYLIVTLELLNKDAAKNITYAGWGGGIYGTGGTNLVDNLQNPYLVKLFSGGIVEGQHRDVSLFGGEPLRDVLVFERPVEAADYLRLSLPGAALGQEGDVRFKIPLRMFHDGPVEQEAEVVVAAVDAPVDSEPVVVENVQEEASPVAIEKQPPPALSEQQEVRRTIEDLFNTQAARTPGQKLATANRMAVQAGEVETGAERFVLLRQASELAAEAGETMRVLQLVDQIAEGFEIDRLGAQAHLLGGMAEKVTSEDQIRTLLVGSAAIIDNALDARRFDLADSLSAVVCQACQCSAGRPFRGEARERRREVEAIQGRWKEVQTARVALQSNPNDETANTIVGRWHCLVCDEWDQGLPYLAKGSEPELKALAERELQGEPEDAKAQVALADAWWDFAKAPDREDASVWLGHSAYWYERAHPELDSALVKAKVEKRLAELGRPIRKNDERDFASLQRDNPELFSPGQRRLSDLLDDDADNTTSEEAALPRAASGGGDPCPACDGKGVIYNKCPNRHCARGTVRSYRTQVVGMNPLSGQKLTQRIAVRVPCPTCGGNYIQKETCSECKGAGAKKAAASQ